MTGFVHVAKETITEIVLFDAGGNTHITERELGHEGVMGFIDTSAVEIITQLLDHFCAKG